MGQDASIMPTLTNERFESSGLTIFQPAHGHRYGRESLALAAFVKNCEERRFCELGSGAGVIALQVAALQQPSSVTAVEIQPSLHAIALENVRTNGLEGIVKCVNEDIRRFAQTHAGSFDVVVANPPFFPASDGRLSPDTQRATARHELNGTIADFVKAARELLVDGGRLSVVFDKRRKEELLSAARACGFSPMRLEEPSGEAYVLGEYAAR